MKIGVYLGDFPPEAGGGHSFQASVFRSFAELYRESEHEYVVICDAYNADYFRDLIHTQKIPVIPLKKRNYLERVISGIERFTPPFRILAGRKRSSKLTQLSEQAGIEFMWFVGTGSHYLDIPYLTVVWDLMHRTDPWYPEVSERGIWDFREETTTWFLRRAAAIITGTAVGREQIMHFYQVPPERITILPHPTPDYAFRTSDQSDTSVLQKYGLPEGYLFYPAQFWPHKNHANLLLALQQLRDEHSIQVPVVFVGSDKGNARYIRDLTVHLRLQDQVHFLGFVPQADIVALYSNALALAYVSFGGPENLPPLEAFATNCPVIAALIPGAKEQLGDAVRFINPADPADIASAVRDISSRPDLRSTLIQNGRERAARWTTNDYMRGVFKIFDDFQSTRRCWGYVSKPVD